MWDSVCTEMHTCILGVGVGWELTKLCFTKNALLKIPFHEPWHPKIYLPFLFAQLQKRTPLFHVGLIFASLGHFVLANIRPLRLMAFQAILCHFSSFSGWVLGMKYTPSNLPQKIQSSQVCIPTTKTPCDISTRPCDSQTFWVDALLRRPSDNKKKFQGLWNPSSLPLWPLLAVWGPFKPLWQFLFFWWLWGKSFRTHKIETAFSWCFLCVVLFENLCFSVCHSDEKFFEV